MPFSTSGSSALSHLLAPHSEQLDSLELDEEGLDELDGELELEGLELEDGLEELDGLLELEGLEELEPLEELPEENGLARLMSELEPGNPTESLELEPLELEGLLELEELDGELDMISPRTVNAAVACCAAGSSDPLRVSMTLEMRSDGDAPLAICSSMRVLSRYVWTSPTPAFSSRRSVKVDTCVSSCVAI
jgi:hypothetical protein